MFIKRGDYANCFGYLSETVKQAISLQQLTEIGQYYQRLTGLWYCHAVSYEEDTHTLVYIPLYFEEDNYRIKLWMGKSYEEIIGLDFQQLDDDKWPEEGKKQWTIDVPKRVLRTDGTVKEVHSPKEELETL